MRILCSSEHSKLCFRQTKTILSDRNRALQERAETFAPKSQSLLKNSLIRKKQSDIERIKCKCTNYQVLDELGIPVMVNLPSISVTLPIEVPFTSTEAPAIGCPSSSEITTPVASFRVWANTNPVFISQQTNNNIKLLFINIFLILDIKDTCMCRFWCRKYKMNKCKNKVNWQNIYKIICSNTLNKVIFTMCAY